MIELEREIEQDVENFAIDIRNKFMKLMMDSLKKKITATITKELQGLIKDSSMSFEKICNRPPNEEDYEGGDYVATHFIEELIDELNHVNTPPSDKGTFRESISEIEDLSKRAKDVLRTAGVGSVGGLVCLSYEKLKETKKAGVKTVKEITDWLVSRRLTMNP